MIEECFNCGISEEHVKLFDAISKEGIAKICKDCAMKENIPILKKPSLINSLSKKNNLENKDQSVYERMSRITGFKPAIKKIKGEDEIQQEKKLKEIVEENFNQKISKEPKPDFLIDNFHWSIMRARRLRHLTQKELGKAISEPEIAIKMIEKGILSRGAVDLIEKIERYLDISVTRPEFRKKERKVGFDSITTKGMTIADLKEMETGKAETTSSETSHKFSSEIPKDSENIWEDDSSLFDEEDLEFE